MDSHQKEKKDSDSATHDTSHLSAGRVTSKKSTTKIIIALAVIVVVIGAAVGGLLYYKAVDEQRKEEQAAAEAAKKAEKEKLSPEEQITKDLVDNFKRQREALQKNDDTKAITNSTAAAVSVGRNLNEQDLKD